MKELKKQLKNLISCLNRPGLDGEEESRLTRALVDLLPDPGMIYRENLLPPEHRLSREALAVTDALETVTNGMFEEEPLQRLDALSPQSPFASWKGLIQAVRGYYLRDSRGMAQGMALIQKQTPPGQLLPLLSDLEAGRSPRGWEGQWDRSSRSLEKLRKAVQEDNELILSDLAHLQEIRQNQMEEHLPETLLLLLRDLLPGYPSAARQLALWGMEELPRRDLPLSPFLTNLKSLLGEEEALRLTAVSTLDEEPDISLLYWIRYTRLLLSREGISASEIEGALSLVSSAARLVEAEGLAQEWEAEYKSALEGLSAALLAEAASLMNDGFPGLQAAAQAVGDGRPPLDTLTELYQPEAVIPAAVAEDPAEAVDPAAVASDESDESDKQDRPEEAAGKGVQLELFAC